MAIRPEEITDILRKQLESFDKSAKTDHVGTVIQVGDGIARVHGLPDCQMGELLEFPNGVVGLALNLEEDSVGAVLIGDDTSIMEGDPVKETGKIIQVPTGKALLGRVVNALGQPIDNKGPIVTDTYQRLETMAPGVVDRQPVTEPLQTGIKAIDAMIPVGRGQRELVIDRDLYRYDYQPEVDPRARRLAGLLHLRCLRPKGFQRCPGCQDA